MRFVRHLPAVRLHAGRMRTGRERRSVARRRKNAVFVGDRGFGPLLEFDHDEIGVRRFVVPGEQNVDPLGAGRNLVLDGDARVFRQRSVVQGVRDVLQRRLPSAFLPGGRPPAFAQGEIHLQLLDDRAVARIFDEAGLVAFVDDHAWGAYAMETVLGDPSSVKTLRFNWNRNRMPPTESGSKILSYTDRPRCVALVRLFS